MTDDTETDNTATPEQVLEALTSLPDEKVPVASVQEKLDDSLTSFSDGLQQLIRLGEVEVCQRRGTGPRVWYKHRDSPGDKPPGKVTEFVWHCYVVKESGASHAERMFETREGAIKHLKLSAGVNPEGFEKVSYLDGVWRASTSGFEGRDPMTAVVRKEPVYAQPMTPENGGFIE